jgi:HNH endonuclease
MTIGHPCSTRRGRKFREAYRNAQPLCEPCLRKGKIAQTDEVHHIVPVSKGGPTPGPTSRAGPRTAISEPTALVLGRRSIRRRGCQSASIGGTRRKSLRTERAETARQSRIEMDHAR